MVKSQHILFDVNKFLHEIHSLFVCIIYITKPQLVLQTVRINCQNILLVANFVEDVSNIFASYGVQCIQEIQFENNGWGTPPSYGMLHV